MIWLIRFISCCGFVSVYCLRFGVFSCCVSCYFGCRLLWFGWLVLCGFSVSFVGVGNPTCDLLIFVNSVGVIG